MEIRDTFIMCPHVSRLRLHVDGEQCDKIRGNCCYSFIFVAKFQIRFPVKFTT